MKTILRYIVAIIFIVSGFVKAVDSVGFSFKLEEYFSPTVFNLPFLETYVLPIAVFVSVLEVVLGVMLLLKIQLRKTLLALILLCVFFGFLTFYSAYFNVVTDCGCFGDAIKFTPWQSFWKDIILLIGLLILWVLYRKNEGNKTFNLIKNIGLALSILIMMIVVFIGIKKEPLIDFRAYKIGTDLNLEKQKIEANPSEYKTFYTLKNNNTGEEKKINQDDYILDKSLWEEGTPWEIQSDKTTSEIVKEGYKSEVSKFRIEDEMDNDITTEILNAPKVVLLFSYKPKELSSEDVKIAENKVKNNALVYGVSTNLKTFSEIKNATM
ncbi:MAG: DoxX family protein, partial [Cruoricaptor ignavus]|nr:DoxX family protein [Cruoricaptor ignavus]